MDFGRIHRVGIDLPKIVHPGSPELERAPALTALFQVGGFFGGTGTSHQVENAIDIQMTHLIPHQ